MSARQLFTARIQRRDYRGLELFWGSIVMGPGGRPPARVVKRIPEFECLAAVQCEVLDWASRHGKREDLRWSYEL